MKNIGSPWRISAFLLAAVLLFSLMPSIPHAQAASSVLTLWDMETLPGDLVATRIAVPYYADAPDYREGNVTLTAANGKGVNGSTALAVSQVGAANWADIFLIYPERDYGAAYDIGDADMLWFWADARQFSNAVSLDLRVDGRYPYIGDTYYVSNSNSLSNQMITDSWDHIHGRISIRAGFIGWVGIPFSSFVTRPNSLASLYFAMTVASEDQGSGKALYLDNFCVGSGTAAPAGLNFRGHSLSGTAATPDVPVWNMEALPDDLYATSLASGYGTTRDNIGVLRASGKGFRGSNALQFLQRGSYDATNTPTVYVVSAQGFARNWRSGDMLMFWADASEFTGIQVALDLSISGKQPAAGTAWYRERGGMLVKAGTLAEAASGETSGRLVLPKGFCGWVGLPLTSFPGGLHEARSMKLHLSYSGTNVSGKSFYLDEFWVITGNRMPEGTATGAGIHERSTVLNANGQPDRSSYININVNTAYQTMQAYGASDCWWTTMIGKRSNIRDVLDLVWGKNGIGLNNYRLNVGGSVQYCRADAPLSFGRAVLSPLNESGVLDITRNAGSWNAYTTLLDMVCSGDAQIDDLTLFMNSPPSSYTVGGNTYSDRLSSNRYSDYGRYVADVVAAYEATGLHVKYVSPVNEPLVGNWTGNTGQEGCIYTSANQIVSVFENTIQALNANGSTTKISPSDFCNWSSASQYLNAIVGNSTVKNHIDHISGHDYGRESASYRSSFASRVQQNGLSVHMTEWGLAIGENADNMDTAIEVAKELYTDLTSMNCDTWSWWLAVGAGGYADGLTYYSTENNVIETTKRLWALGNFSRFTVGATRIGVNTAHLPSGLSVTAFRKGNRLIYTVINENASASSLSFAGLPTGAQANAYVTSEAYNCEQIGRVTADKAVSLPARSIVTLVFDGIDWNAVSSTAAPGNPTVGRVLDFEDIDVTSGSSTNQPSLVSAYSAVGTGFQTSTAAALSYDVWDSAYYWDTAFRLSPSELGGSSNWSAGDTLWFWLDASAMTADCYLQVDISDGTNRQFPIGGDWYLWRQASAPIPCTSVKTWEGATCGRFPIPAGYTGFVGIPLGSYSGLNKSTIQSISFYFEPQGETLPAILYLDEFWLTANGAVPNVPSCTHTRVQTLPAIAPTCAESGMSAGTVCSDCGAIVTAQAPVPATGLHNYVNWMCTQCGTQQPFEEPKLHSVSMRLDEDIDLLFEAALPYGCTDIYMEFTVNGVSCTVTDYSVEQDGRYRFAYTGITPQRMTDSITAVLHATCNNTHYTDTVTDYSVKSYCENLLSKENPDSKLSTLLSNLLVYGAATQTYTGYRLDCLATEGLALTPSTFPGISGFKVSYEGEQSSTADWTYATLRLSNSLGIRFGFETASIEGLTVKVAINGRTQVFDAEHFVSGGNGKYYVDFRQISAAEFDAPVTAEFYLGNTKIGRTIQYSVNTYICCYQNANTTPGLQSLLQALYNYGTAAKAYKTNG